MAIAAVTGTAQAQCAWTGYGWSCPQPYAAQPYAGYPYGQQYRNPDAGFGYYGPTEQYNSARFGPDPGGGYRHVGRSNIGHID